MPLFHWREVLDHKYWWRGKTVSTFKIYFQTWKFLHKTFDKSCLKVRKIKRSEFQKLYVWRPSNCKQSFFITWIFYHLTGTCSNYAIEWNEMSDWYLRSDSKRNEIGSSTARNFNNSWLLYVKFSKTINLCWIVSLTENWKCQLFLFLK